MPKVLCLEDFADACCSIAPHLTQYEVLKQPLMTIVNISSWCFLHKINNEDSENIRHTIFYVEACCGFPHDTIDAKDVDTDIYI